MRVSGRVWPTAVLAAALVAVSLHASTPKYFKAATQADFLKGDVENLSIDSNGRLQLGPATELVYETAAPFLWAIAGGSDGAVFVGTGNEGKVFRIDASGKGTSFFDAAELEVHALAPAPNGGLYVATSPDGRIYRVDRTGNATPFFDPDDKYIWALASDGRGTLYAGTGEKGIVYKIAPDGTGAPFYTTKATHAMALALDTAGNLLVGTGTPGRVVRVAPDGKAFVLLDSPFQEIRSLRFDDKGVLFAAALNGRPAGGAAPEDRAGALQGASEAARIPVPSVSTEITSISIVDVSPVATASTAPREERRSVRGGVYRIAADGEWDEIWESRDDSPYDIAFDQNGGIIVGTGSKGKIYRLEGSPVRATLLARAAGQQVTGFHRDARGRLLYSTANPGKLFRLSAERATRGTYESQAQDAQMLATWGSVSWRGTVGQGNTMEMSTRSGNTETPDDTWSAWSSAYTTPDASAITSPKARYLQWRVVLAGKGEGPVLTSIDAAYLQRNVRPQVRSITVHPPGIVFQKPYSTGEPDLAGFGDQTTPERKLTAVAMSAAQNSTAVPALGRKTYAKGLQTLIWKAEDENDDDLRYDVLCRREGETVWTPLRRGLDESILVWDTSTVPNGTYFVKVVASDGLSNPAATALTGELESGPLEIDNTPPSIAIQSVRAEGGRTVVSFEVKDDHSPVQKVEFSTDGQQWRAVFPTDGIADSKSESYELVLEGVIGERGLALRATDAMNNVANLQVDAPRRR